MAKGRKRTSTEKPAEEAEVTTSAKPVEEVKKKEAPKPKVKEPPVRPEPMMSFDRWFAQTGKPVHHKAGMRAYLKRGALKGKRTVAAWDRLFKNY